MKNNAPLVMGILNVTPDSFSDGGLYSDPVKALERALKMRDEGASIIDIGAESSRPGAAQVTADAEIERLKLILPEVVKRTGVTVSIDTCKYEVAAFALDNGATMINDITGAADERMFGLAKETGASLVLMHMQKHPADMQDAPAYLNVVNEVRQYLTQRAFNALKCGLSKENVLIDPGIGFGKTVEHNLEIIRNIDSLVVSGFRVVIGISRKSFLGKLLGRDTDKRLSGALALTAFMAMKGVSVFRTHDVAETFDALKALDSLNGLTEN